MREIERESERERASEGERERGREDEAQGERESGTCGSAGGVFSPRVHLWPSSAVNGNDSVDGDLRLTNGAEGVAVLLSEPLRGARGGGRLRRDSRPLKTTRKTTGRAQSAQCSERQTVRAQSERMGVQPAWGGKGSMEGARAGGGV